MATEKSMVEHRYALHLSVLRERWDAYQEQCQEDFADGHRPHYCFHGKNLWVDYDVICSQCEEGLTLEQTARILAESDVAITERRQKLVIQFRDEDMPEKLRMELIDWSLETLLYQP